MLQMNKSVLMSLDHERNAVCHRFWFVNSSKHESDSVFIEIANKFQLKMEWNVPRRLLNCVPKCMEIFILWSEQIRVDQNHFVRTTTQQDSHLDCVRNYSNNIKKKIQCDAFRLHNAMLNKMWPCEDDGYSEKMPRATYN